MSQQIINNGETGLIVRNAINNNFTELYDLATSTNYYTIAPTGVVADLNTTGANDQVAINSFLSTVGNQKRTIVFNAGVYNLTSAINLPSNITIYISKGATINITADQAFLINTQSNIKIEGEGTINCTGLSSAITSIGHYNLEVVDITITGNSTGSRGGICLDGQFASANFEFTKVNNVKFIDLVGTRSIRLYPRNGFICDDVEISNCYFKNSFGELISLDAYSLLNNVKIINNIAIDTIAPNFDREATLVFGGIAVNDMIKNVLIQGNTFKSSVDCRQGFVQLYSYRNLKLLDNTAIVPLYSYGMFFALGRVEFPCYDTIVSNNYIEGYDSAVDPDSSINFTFENNTIKNAWHQAGFLGYGIQEFVTIRDNTWINSGSFQYRTGFLLGNSFPKITEIRNNKIIDNRDVNQMVTINNGSSANNQTVTLSTGTYTLGFAQGDGSMSISAGTGVATNLGTATKQVNGKRTFTVTTGGTFNITLAGNVDTPMLCIGSELGVCVLNSFIFASNVGDFEVVTIKDNYLEARQVEITYIIEETPGATTLPAVLENNIAVDINGQTIYSPVGSQDLSGLVPYTGATTNVDLGANNITANKVKLNTTPTLGTLSNGDIYWDVNNHTASLVLDSVNGVVGQILQEQHIYVRNNSGATIPNGSIVYQTGVIGGHPSVALAIATSENTTYPLAVATQDIPNNANGYCTTNGMVRGLNTNSYTENDELFLSATIAGQFTATPPTSPHYVVKIGSVIVKNPANGEILIDIHNPISNNNALGTSQKIGATQNSIKTYVDTGLGTKQNTLVSGVNIKTIYNNSILGSGNIQDNGDQLAYFGSGIDGNVTISGSTVVTLTRPMYYNNLTITGNAQILTGGFPVYVAGILDISGATNPTGAFNFAGNAGQAGNVNGTAGVQPAVQNNSFFGAGSRGAIGGAGTTTTGGSGGAGVSGLAGVSVNDCGSGASKGGGAGSGGIGGAGRGAQTSSFRTPLHLTTTWMFGATLITGGCSGGGGGAGGGNSTNSGPGGGSGGSGGGILAVFANTINRSSSTVAGVFNASGGNGGAGTTTNQNNCGGSSGGGGGGGGAILIIYSNLTGTSTTNAFNVNGGNGATGGSGLGTGVGASGTDGGNAGIVVLFNLGAGTMTLYQQTVAPTVGVLVGSGNAGGAGGTGGQLIANF